MFERRLLFVAGFIVLILGLHVWRGKPSDVGRSNLTGTPPLESHEELASPASLPSRSAANLKLLHENLPAPEKKKLAVLEEIITSKNDNDPRLDTEFRQLSPEFKRALEGRYFATAKEKLNERGTVVFLLGREAKTPADLAFLKSVTKERPCLSLGDCRKADEPSTDAHGHDHDDGVSERTLVYPQTVAMKSMERCVLSPGADPGLKQEALKFLRELAHHDDRRISLVAQDILRRAPQ